MISDTTTVTKSDVDTFSFINFVYDTNAVPGAAEGFVFDLRVDAPQPHTRETVVFVELADGARFIVNTGGATCRDVLELIDKVRAAVLDRFGTELEPEIRIVS